MKLHSNHTVNMKRLVEALDSENLVYVAFFWQP